LGLLFLALPLVLLPLHGLVPVISEILKEARKQANITQEELAEKIGTPKSYISRLEIGKLDIQLSTLFKIFEIGLGRHIRFTIQ